MNLRCLFITVFSLFLVFPDALISQVAVERTQEQEPGLLPEQAAEEPPKTEEAADKPQRAKKESTAAERRPLQDMMTADEFRAAGLEKLSDAELKNLNAWLQGYRATTEKKVTEEVTQEVTQKVTEKVKASRPKLDTVVSRVAGTFNGLTGSTIIKLEDGSSWKQANSEDRHRPQITDHPSAAVMRTSFGWKMRIAGTPDFYVDPVR